MTDDERAAMGERAAAFIVGWPRERWDMTANELLCTFAASEIDRLKPGLQADPQDEQMIMWDVCEAALDNHTGRPTEALASLLDDGWEPFSSIGHGDVTFIQLRRRVIDTPAEVVGVVEEDRRSADGR